MPHCPPSRPRRRCAWITRGHLQVEHVENEAIRYAVLAEHDRLDVEIALAPHPRASAALNGESVLDWHG